MSEKYDVPAKLGPFGETTCLPLSHARRDRLANDAIQGNFVTGQQADVSWTHNSFFRAGSYGLDWPTRITPRFTNNIFTCNGSGSPSR